MASKTLSAQERKRLNDLVFFHTLRQVDLLRERGELAEGQSCWRRCWHSGRKTRWSMRCWCA
ncbi:hypothetical protein ACVBEH_12755 [Roseateles sp. GG27B]